MCLQLEWPVHDPAPRIDVEIGRQSSGRNNTYDNPVMWRPRPSYVP
jgi:hypothetical protein